MIQINLYKSVLKKLSLIPVEYLQQVDNFLSSLTEKITKKEQNRKAILDFAGSWADMSKNDFKDYLRVAKETGEELFKREINL